MSKTNDTTNAILKFLFSAGVFAWRQNVLPVPLVRNGVATGFRPGSKIGLPDIMGVVPPGLYPARGRNYGIPLCIEVKTGKDKLRPEQIGFHHNARNSGCIVMVVKDFEDFQSQWSELTKRVD